MTNDLILGSGTLAPSGNLTVGGSWHNVGGLFSAGSHTVTLTSTGAEVIRSAAQPFKNLTLNGSGATWALDDWMKVDGTLALTAGTLSPGEHATHAGGVTRTSGTFTAGTGTVVLDTTADTTQAAAVTFNNLRLETSDETGLLGYWKLDEGQGTTTRDATGIGNSGTLTNGPLWRSSSLPSTVGFANYGAVTFDGSNDYVTVGNPAGMNVAGQITMAAWVYPADASALQNCRNIIVHSNATTQTFLRIAEGSWWEAGSWLVGTSAGNTSGGAGYIAYESTIPGDAATWTHIAASYDGTTWRMYKNGVAVGTTYTTGVGAQSIASGTWSIGGGPHSGHAGTCAFSGAIDDVRVYSSSLTAKPDRQPGGRPLCGPWQRHHGDPGRQHRGQAARSPWTTARWRPALTR